MVKPDRKLFGLIGHPLGHTYSPALHQFVLQRIEVEGCYHAFDTPAAELSAVIEGMRALGFAGFNVTVPHKQAVLKFLDERDPMVEEVGAVNTVRFRDGRLLGYNTDVVGFARALEQAGVEARGKVALVLGAGGAARAVVVALIRAGVARMVLHNRTVSRAEELAEHARTKLNFAAVEVSTTVADLPFPEFDLVINATSVGMCPHTQARPLEFREAMLRTTVMDLVYNPIETAFLHEARAAGARTLDGLDMFIFQGLEALRLWLDREVDVPPSDVRKFLIQRLRCHEPDSISHRG